MKMSCACMLSVLTLVHVYCFIGCFDIGSITVSTVTRRTTATITFSSHQDATFTCQLDGGAVEPCKYNKDCIIIGFALLSHT